MGHDPDEAPEVSDRDRYADHEDIYGPELEEDPSLEPLAERLADRLEQLLDGRSQPRRWGRRWTPLLLALVAAAALVAGGWYVVRPSTTGGWGSDDGWLTMTLTERDGRVVGYGALRGGNPVEIDGVRAGRSVTLHVEDPTLRFPITLTGRLASRSTMEMTLSRPNVRATRVTLARP